MAETKKMRNWEEMRNYINDVIVESDVRVRDIEEDCGFSLGLISRWKKMDPSVEKVILLLDKLGIDIVLTPRTCQENIPDVCEDDKFSNLSNLSQETLVKIIESILSDPRLK